MSWDASAGLANGDPNGAAFDGNATLDPSIFMNGPGMTAFDFAAPASSQPSLPPQHAPAPSGVPASAATSMPNGDMRNGSPAVQNPMYQTSSVVPSKRPLSDYTASPRQPSRSHTPQQAPYPGYAVPPNGQAPPGSAGLPPQQFSQANSSHTSPSPVMSHQGFNGHAVPPSRLQTASPSPFSPAGAPSFNQQGSPPPPQPGIDPNANGATPYMQGSPYVNRSGGTPQPGFPPGQTPTPQPQAGVQGPPPPPGHPAHAGQTMQMAYGQGMPGYPAAPMNAEGPRRLYEAKQQAIARQMQSHAGPQQAQQPQQAPQMPLGTPNAGMASQQQVSPNAAATYREGLARMQHAHKQWTQPTNPEQFVRSVGSFLQQRQQPFLPIPIVGGRQIHSMYIYSVVMRMGGSRKVNGTNGWHNVAATLQVAQAPTAAQELQSFWMQYLVHYETWIIHTMQQQRQRFANGPPAAAQAGPQRPPQQQPQSLPPGSHQMTPQMAQGQLPPQAAGLSAPGAAAPPDAALQAQTGPPNSVSDGMQSQQPQPSVDMSVRPPSATPQPNGVPRTDGGMHPDPRQSMPPQGPIGQPAGPPAQMSAQEHLGTLTPIPKVENGDLSMMSASDPASSSPMSFKQQMPGPPSRSYIAHGGYTVYNAELGVADGPDFDADIGIIEMGPYDVRTLTMQLQCGIPGEVGLALHALTAASYWDEIPLMRCHDLIDALVECGEEQLDFLIEGAPEHVADGLCLPAYDELTRRVRQEDLTVPDVPEFGSAAYELDCAADRLLCISAIMRNLVHSGPSDSELPPPPPQGMHPNHPHHQQYSHAVGMYHRGEETRTAMAEPLVIKFYAQVIRALGSHDLLLRTWMHTIEFMTDTVRLFSRIAERVKLPNRDDASAFVHFLLVFAPPLETPLHDNADDDYESHDNGDSAPMTNGHDYDSSHEPPRLSFPVFREQLHPFYKPAQTILAKLLAHGEPNLTLLRHVFLNDTLATDHEHTSGSLLTRALAMSLASLPPSSFLPSPASTVPSTGLAAIAGADKPRLDPVAVYMARVPVLGLGLLAADNLLALMPPSGTPAAARLMQSWLRTPDAWPLRLLHLIVWLCTQQPDRLNPLSGGGGDAAWNNQYVQSIQQRMATMKRPFGPGGDPRAHRVDWVFAAIVVHSGLGILRRIAERVRNDSSLAQNGSLFGMDTSRNGLVKTNGDIDYGRPGSRNESSTNEASARSNEAVDKNRTESAMDVDGGAGHAGSNGIMKSEAEGIDDAATSAATDPITAMTLQHDNDNDNDDNEDLAAQIRDLAGSVLRDMLYANVDTSTFRDFCAYAGIDREGGLLTR